MKETVGKLLEFMKILEKVCQVKRDTRLSDGVTESDSDHIFKLTFLVMMIFPYLQKKYDYTRMLELALVHDIAEGVAGDCPRSVQAAHPEYCRIKAERELQAIESYKKMLPEPLNEKIFSLFSEYEQKLTPEAKIVAVLDKMEANLQANRFAGGDIRYWQDCENGNEYYKIATAHKPLVTEIDEEILRVMEKAIIALTLENMQRWKIES